MKIERAGYVIRKNILQLRVTKVRNIFLQTNESFDIRWRIFRQITPSCSLTESFRQFRFFPSNRMMIQNKEYFLRRGCVTTKHTFRLVRPINTQIFDAWKLENFYGGLPKPNSI